MTRRSLALLVAGATVLGGAGSALAATSPIRTATATASTTAAASPTALTGWVSGAKEILWPKGVHPTTPQAPPSPQQYNNLIFHGGAVMHRPEVFLIFWGTQWKKGFTTGPGYTQKTAINYESQFFAHVGGSAWAGTQTQYCDGITAGSVSCKGEAGAHYTTNPSHVLHGVWIDSSAAPSQIVTSGLAENVSHDPLAGEAIKASEHFQTHSPDALFMIFTPPSTMATAYGSVYCAYHSEVSPVGGNYGIRYAFMPFTPEQGSGCGGNSVNHSNNSFGNGYFDSYTLAGGHEWEEAVTDPDAYPFQDGWNDYQTSENGDKCAYFDTKNLHLGGHLFAVQPLWSNEANGGTGGCADRRGTGKFPVPPPLPV